MALAHLALGLPPLGCWTCRSGGWVEQPGAGPGLGLCGGAFGGGGGRALKGVAPALGLSSGGREVVVNRGRLKVEASPVDVQNRPGVEIPVTCYQILGIAEQAEKDEIVKSVIELKGSEIEDGYTTDAILSRQNLLMDVRDKLLFEPEYAGNIREKIPPKCTLRIPWAWLTGALCLLQEVGEEKLVLEIGQTALHHQDAKPYAHDLLLSMALAECSIAKASFEKNKVSQGFEALARAQYILRSKTTFKKMPLVSQIEESLEELAPTCTLEILSMPCTPDNVERRSGAIAALRELLRQGLEVETSCRVQDWATFLNQALNKLSASEIFDLLPWDDLAATRKNKKSLESQNQRTVIEFDCFYLAMIAHIALGFSRRQADLIQKAKIICECLVASEGVDLKFEEGICSLLLGKDAKTITIEKLNQLEINGRPVGNSKLTVNKEGKGIANNHQSLEIYLKEAVLDLFPDTEGCSPSLANFFGGQRKLLPSSKQIASKATNSRTGLRLAAFNLSHDNQSSKEAVHMNSRHLGEAVKQLAPANLQSQQTDGKGSGSSNSSSIQLKRELGAHQKKFWESWWSAGNFTRGVVHVAFVGCVAFSSILLLYMQLCQIRVPCKVKSTYPKVKTGDLTWTMSSSDCSKGPSRIDKKNIIGSLGEMLVLFRKQFKNPTGTGALQTTRPAEEYSNFASTGGVVLKRQMPLEEAEALLKHWQTVKAEALGPKHKALSLSEVLSEPMLSQWQDLADTAKAKSCFWRFVLLQMCILRADIISDEVGEEKAEIEAVLEEAAELVDRSQPQPKNPNYYSTYKMSYLLKRQLDGSWKFYGGGIQAPS